MAERILLDSIDSPEDVKRLRFNQLPRLASEIRSRLILTVSRTGGHLASNLGVVELTIALHRVFQSPIDQIVFDVGHQCYVHKLLTGRRGQFGTLRQSGGLSGFPKRAESVHDAFIAGHSSTSISAALGIARAKRLLNEPGKVVAVIGDGAFSGMAFEALNDITERDANLIVIVNDNEMSISRNMTTFARHLTRIRNTTGYYEFKDGLERTVQRIPMLGRPLRNGLAVVKSAAKDWLYHSNLFEDMGFTYLGPVEGHNLVQLCAIYKRAKMLREPVLIHVHTQKGKGYRQAEENPGAFHGVSTFDPHKWQKNELPSDSFSEQAGQYLARLGEKDKRIVAITAAMKYATGLHHFSSRFREEGRFFDVGIAESHAAVFACAMATKGLLPVFAVYSSFLQRAFDQLLHDGSLEPVHLVLGVDRAGLVGEDGETHQGIFDVPYLSMLPGMVIYSPFTYAQLRRDFDRALYEETGLTAVRYPRGRQAFALPDDAQERGDYCILHASPERGGSFQAGSEAGAKPGSPLLAVTYGRITQNVYQAVRDSGKPYDIYVLERIFPIPQDVLSHALTCEKVLFVEESAAEGGLAQKMGAWLLAHHFTGRYQAKAIGNPVVQQGTVEQCMRAVGLDAGSIRALL